MFSYDAAGNLVSVTDPLNHKTEFRYDQRNRRLETKDPQAGRTQFEYDLDNNLIAVIDPLGNQTKFVYDARNRLTYQNDPLDNWTVYDYDPVNNLVAQTDRNNRATQFQYDELDRLVTETWVGTAQVIQHAYDKASNLTSITDRSSRLTYTYDNQNRVKTVNNTGTPGTPPVVLSYTYDPVGNIRSLTNTINGQSGGSNNYTYDTLNCPTQITQSGAGVINKRINLAYNALSQFTNLKRYADLTGTQLVAASDYTYDTANRLTNLTHTKSATTFANYTWTYDAANRITQFTLPDGTSNYTYDLTDQLTGTNHSYQANETYSYDTNGNRINTGYRTGTNNRLLTDSTYNYEYDNEGNRTKRTAIATAEVTEYVWDHRNRLTRVVTKSASGNITKEVKYTYDVYDRRIAKAVDPDGTGSATASVERFVYDGAHIALVFNGSGTKTNRYLHGPEIDQILADENAQGQVLWPLTDNQGTIRDLINSTGTIQNHLKYNSFGRVTSESNAAIDHRFGYTGRELDEETGLYYYRTRYYDPVVGRFISEDPIGFEAKDTNLYRYVFNDPVNNTDPSGLDLSDNCGPPLTLAPTAIARGGMGPANICPAVPPGVSTRGNMDEARRNFLKPFWFYNQVKNRGPWDYKQRGRQYQSFGNFNYGATGRSLGIIPPILLREAGRAQQKAGASRPEWGNPGPRWNPFGGVAPYGDDPVDQLWIKRGMRYYENVQRGSRNPCTN